MPSIGARAVAGEISMGPICILLRMKDLYLHMIRIWV